ncbi:MAG TPA: fluoride efflux transporter CrcB [Candidatus Kapabacteria bacterium]|nr:fluoride efflux transporter CrcB [Candidatus Kapabacteria bacterium]
MFKQVLIVGIAGLIGTVSRFLSNHIIHKYFITSFPIGSLLVNLVGCFLIGFFLGLFEKGSLVSADLKLFLTVGFCGGFTTFSTFSNDSINLYNNSDFLNLMMYLGVSIFAGIFMTFLGKLSIDWILK